MIGNRAMKPMSKSSPSITGNTNINNNSIVHDAADSDLLLRTATAALRDRHPPVAANGGIRSQQQQQQHQHHNEDRSVPKQQRIQPQAAAETMRCLETRSVASQVRSAAPAPIVAWNGGLRANFTETPKETAASVDVTDGGGAVKLVPPAEIEVDDPYAELERILEKAQAEISEMFAQTVRAEKMKAVATSVPSPEPEDGSQVKRTSNSEQARRDDRGREVRREGSSGLQQQQHQQHHQEHTSHHRKYATIPHASVATTPSRNAAFTRRTAEEGEPKRTRNTLDPRYRSTELEVVSSAATTGAAGGRGTTPAAASSASSLLLQTSSDSSNNGYGGRTELSDSLSDDMSLLDVGAPYTDGARDDCAGDDETTSDEMVMHSFKRHHHHPSGPAPGTTMPATTTTTTTPATVFRSSGFYRKHNDSPPSDRSMKTSTNSLPSMAGTAHRNLALHLKFKTHQSAIDAKRKQFFLALDQEPFQPLKSNMADLPSPSSTSLHSGHNHLIAEELGSKSSSAPVLLKDEENGLAVQRANLRYSRSQSDRHLAEIEAIEACRWLRAAGFPQYAQMYEDHQFPIDVENVEKDHPFLESDPLQSLFRRLHTLNRCANMHLDVHQHHHTPKPSQREDSDDDSCALSEAWTFQHNSRRWSRVDDSIGLVSVIANKQQKSSALTKDAPTKGPADSIDSATAASNGSRHSRAKHGGTGLVRAEDHEKLWLEGGGKITIGVPSDTDSQDDSAGAVHLRRTGSERLKDGAKAILRRVESIKSRRRKKQYRDGLIILAPHANTHLSPHHHRGADGELIIGPDIMSYSNPTSPRPSAEMLQFDDGLAMMGRHKNLFSMDPTPGDGQERNLLSPYMPNAANAWSPVTPLMQRGVAGGDRNTPNVLLPFQVQLQQQEARSGDDSSSICSEDSGGGPGVEFDSAPRHTGGGGSGRGEKLRSKYARTKKALRSKMITSTVDDYRDACGGGALSDSEYQSKQRRSKIKIELDRDTGASVTTSSGSPAGTAPKANQTTTLAPPVTSSKLHRGGSLNLGKASKRYRDAFSNRSVRHSTKASNDEWGEGVGRGGSKRSTVARWHSFQQPKVSPIEVVQQQAAGATTAPDHLLTVASIHPTKDGEAQRKQQQKQRQLVSSTNATGTTGSRPVEGAKQLPLDSVATGTAAGGALSSGAGLRVSEMSCGQLLVVRKLGLVKLTGYMERHCPTHRSGWNWDLPKFIKRIKTPDYKDRKVFGMPLVLNLQRYGSTVPYTIRMAFAWLERNALDQVGLFRKPGVKSRIAKLKSVIETSNDVGCRSELFDEYHAYDVADLLKQYFRELPDALLTAKLSETFIAIFQYLPDEVRAEAVQSAILLLPDEHREVLHLLLTFLDKVVQNSSLNQMTANNLAVCFAPSLLYLLTGNRYTTASPRRKKMGTGSGTPDERELSEAKASHECLAFMIDRFHSLWTITSDQMRRCNFNYMDESKPVPLASLGAEMHVQNWRGYLSECLNECLREGRERPRGWVSLSSTDPSVAVFFKKVGDGHPLRLWKCVTEVEAPPMEVIQHIVNERPLWDAYLLKWRTIEQLDQDADVFQYACGQPITEYCVVRQWKNDLPRGACVIVELSISHENATPLLGGVAGVVLVSRYLIEPCGSGKCKLMHLSRVDMKGRTPDWYNKNYGHICQQYLSKIKKFFEHCTEGPETKV